MTGIPDLLQLASAQDGDAFDTSVSKLALLLELSSRRSVDAEIDESFFKSFLGADLYSHHLTAHELDCAFQFLLSKMTEVKTIEGIVHAFGYAPIPLVSVHVIPALGQIIDSCSPRDLTQVQYLLEKVLSYWAENAERWSSGSLNVQSLKELVTRMESRGVDVGGIKRRFTMLKLGYP